MRKLLIIFVIIIFTAAGVGVFLYIQKQSKPVMITEETCDKMPAINIPFISLFTSNDRADCYNIVAINDNKPLLCEKITDKDIKDSCLYNVEISFIAKKDISSCDDETQLLKTQYKWICYAQVGMYTKDESVCNKIGLDPEAGYYYRDTCYERIAGFTKNPETCEKIINVDSRDACYLDIAKFSPSLSLCNKIKSNSEARDICYIFVARDKKNVSLCSKIEDGMYNKTCYVNVGVAKEDMSVCDKLADEDEQKVCYEAGYLMFALLKKDVVFCDKIDAESEIKNGCYVEVAALKKDKTICEKISGENAKEAKEQCLAGKSELSGE